MKVGIAIGTLDGLAVGVPIVGSALGFGVGS